MAWNHYINTSSAKSALCQDDIKIGNAVEVFSGATPTYHPGWNMRQLIHLICCFSLQAQASDFFPSPSWSSPSPLIHNFCAGDLLPGISLWLLKAAASSCHYLSAEKFAFLPVITSFPSPGSSLSMGNILTHRKSPGALGEAVRIWVRPHSVWPPRAMQFASLSSWGSSLALTESILLLHLPTVFGHSGVFLTLWLKCPRKSNCVTTTRNLHLPLELPLPGAQSWSSTRAGQSQGPNAPPRAGTAASAKEKKSITDSTAASPEESCSTGLTDVKTKGDSPHGC